MNRDFATRRIAAIVCTALLSHLCSAKSRDGMEIIYPDNSAGFYNSSCTIVLVVNDDKIKQLQLRRFGEVRRLLEVDPSRFEMEFPRLIRSLFSEEFLLTRLEYTAIRPSLEDERRQVSIRLQEGQLMNLNQFWTSVEFAELYTNSFSDTTSKRIELLAEGYFISHFPIENGTQEAGLCNYQTLDLTLANGINDMMLSGHAGNGDVLVELPLSLHLESMADSLNAGRDKELEIPFHSPDLERKCVECHRMEPMAAEIENPDSPARSCTVCHQSMVERSFLHEPSSDWNCLYCHERQQNSDYEILKGLAVSNQCYKCHEQFQSLLAVRRFVHSPLKKQSCTVCHDPHGSAQKAELVEEPNRLCLRCHGEGFAKDHPTTDHPVRGGQDLLDSGSELSCLTCHDAHASDNAALLKNVDGAVIGCQSCHKK